MSRYVKINFKYFKESIFITVIGFIAAFFWSEHVSAGSGLMGLFAVCVLSVLEVSLSFDNAVINAMKLEHMTQLWQHRFLTWGILIAVFGMRFLFPILVVSVFTGLGMLSVTKIALFDSIKYSSYLQLTHAPIVTFGGMFLMMLFWAYFSDKEKDIHWIKHVEAPLTKVGNIKGICLFLCMLFLILTVYFQPQSAQKNVFFAGLSGIITYLIIDNVSNFLEKKDEKMIAEGIKRGGLVSFLYLELIDASFSLDGVLGAFAISRDIIIIMIGLGIGAMFVRSLTVMLVEKKVLKQFLYLEHGAHWAIGALSVIMLMTTVMEVPEFVTGTIGLIFILSALYSSIKYNRDMDKKIC